MAMEPKLDDNSPLSLSPGNKGTSANRGNSTLQELTKAVHFIEVFFH